MFMASLFTPEAIERFERHNAALRKAWDDARKAGESLPSTGCFCSSCDAKYINILKRLPREFGGYAEIAAASEAPLPSNHSVEVRGGLRESGAA